MVKNMMASVLCCLPCATGWGMTGASADCVLADTVVQGAIIDTVYVESSSRRRMVRSTAPMQMIDRKEMQALGVTDMADALHRMPGINLRDYGGAGGMKTVAVRGFGAQHTGVAYDGMLLSECQGGEIDVARYSLDHVQSLKLTIGDNEDLFVTARQASVPALLSIETMNEIPEDRRPHVTAQVRYGSFGYVNPFAKYTQRCSLGLTLAWVGEYVYAENDYPFTLRNGIYRTRERRTNSRMNSGHTELNAHWRAGRRSQLWAKAYYYDNDRQLPGIVRYYTSLCAETLRERNFFAQARWIMRSHDDRWMLKANAKFNWATSAYADSLVANRLDDASYWQREYYASLALLWAPCEHWALDYSADYFYNNLNSTLSTDNHPHRHSVLQSLSAKYAGGRWVALARLLSSVYLQGAEWGESARDCHRLSPSLSLSYHLVDLHRSDRLSSDVFLRASFKDIFRVPTFNENYFFHYGSTDLDPEKTQQWNLGVTWNHRRPSGSSMSVTLDGYANRVRDKIVGVPYNMFVWRMANLGKVDVKGVDVSWKAARPLCLRRPGSSGQVTLSLSYSYQHVVNHTDKESDNYGKQVAYIPEHSGSVAVGWENPWLNVSLHGTGMSVRWANNNHYEGTDIDGYWDLGLTAYRTFRIGRSRWEVRGDLRNLLNRQYEIVANYPMPGRNWQVSVTYKI